MYWPFQTTLASIPGHNLLSISKQAFQLFPLPKSYFLVIWLSAAKSQTPKSRWRGKGILKETVNATKILETLRDLYLTWLRSLTDQHHVTATLFPEVWESVWEVSYQQLSSYSYSLLISPRNPLFNSTHRHKSSNPGEFPDLNREFQLFLTKVKGSTEQKSVLTPAFMPLICLLFLPSSS